MFLLQALNWKRTVIFVSLSVSSPHQVTFEFVLLFVAFRNTLGSSISIARGFDLLILSGSESESRVLLSHSVRSSFGKEATRLLCTVQVVPHVTLIVLSRGPVGLATTSEGCRSPQRNL